MRPYQITGNTNPESVTPSQPSPLQHYSHFMRRLIVIQQNRKRISCMNDNSRMNISSTTTIDCN
jgi:hypothetical protein